MNKEYIVISKTAIQKRIEELEKRSHLGLTDEEWNNERGQEKALKQILSQSTPLIPEIEKAFDAGRKLSDKSQLYTPDFHWTKEDYISNLKLDI